MRAMLSVGLIWLLGCFAMAATAQEATRYQEGKHYVKLPSPAPVEEPDKIEVAELFWYGCGHCFSFEPIIGEWKKDLPEDVHFRPVPAFFGGAWDTHGQLYYTLDSLDKLDETHTAVFQAMHNQKNRLADQEAMIKFLEPYGITGEEFTKAWSSFGVRAKIEQAKRLAKAYRASGVPTLIVNGKYRIEGGMAGSFEDMLKVADYLVEQERKAL
ncbi:thiol:disulfide interchange protein DsbA/DsbL [Pseudomonas sp. gcc21]|uniref:thiol:disulfide interchange protein DsbA/DsbL n=1 Tax=Pseudomonas sp. gcc21 TaxID=2726989 RepID=UPI0014515ECF|nr:thiol:disulfide interchange protein DsbA/DsbL [Pseudomonas sp. gcc21]QJD59779.1 thiol:disulfide interchange protein DsbA/DsbL [Pseudomonas sp. gcc21]